MDLEQLRSKVNKIDTNILRLLNQRAFLTLEIGNVKARKKEAVYVPDREKQIFDRIKKLNKGPLSNGALKAIYGEIMSASLSLEKDLGVAYLGPPATFTHSAALKKFGSQVKFLDCSNITDIFNEVEKDHVDYGVVPIENSIEGAVNHTLDMFIDSNLKICSEITLEVSHNLLGNYPLYKIKKVFSNPQVFGQCRLWLESKIPNVEKIEVSSTTKAAQCAGGEKNAACIASLLAAKIYRLKVIAESIEDSPHNRTRFLVISKTDANPTGKDKTSIMFSVKDRVGALHDMLVPFKKEDINLTKIESRPSKRKIWEYFFFVDLEGHSQDEDVKRALKELEKNCTYLKILGSYPAET